MVIQFSPLANRAIDKYRESLRLPKYHCTEEQENEKAQQMIQYIVDKISNTMIELQECPFIKLGKKRGTKGKDFNKKLKWFQYKVSANNAWGVSVLYDENGNALVYRIVHCKYLKEPSPGWKQQSNSYSSQQDKQKVKESAKWIPLQNLNKQIKKEITMKWKRIYNESKTNLWIVKRYYETSTDTIFDQCDYLFDSIKNAAAFIVLRLTGRDDVDLDTKLQMVEEVMEDMGYQGEKSGYSYIIEQCGIAPDYYTKLLSTKTN